MNKKWNEKLSVSIPDSDERMHILHSISIKVLWISKEMLFRISIFFLFCLAKN